MFQTFEATTAPGTCRARVGAVRALMVRAGLDALLVPRSDAHQGEYVPAAAERLRWLSSFTGSAGLAIVAQSRAVLLVDGRYTTQAKGQTDTRLFEIVQISDPFEVEADRWLCSNLAAGGVVGFDPWLHTVDHVETLKTGLARHQLALRATPTNLVDKAWGNARPPMPVAPIEIHHDTYSGRSASDKITALQHDLKSASETALVLTSPDNIAWLFNIRGSDVPHNPVALGFAIVPSKGKPELFLAPEKLDHKTRQYLLPLAKIRAPEDLRDRIKSLSAGDGKIRLDPKSAAYWFIKALGSSSRKISRAADPVTSAKAKKNDVELAGARRAHERDGTAVCEFLAWFDRTATTETVDEITAAKKLEEFRRRTNRLRDISFDTIAGSGSNGAIVHYRVTDESNRQIKNGDLFLIDSGGQYQDGTTDISRTIAVGTPNEEARERFTLVLKGHIAIARSRFPLGTRGVDIDAFARAALWSKGLDYDHGTGHGVGSFLSVHEGPQSLSRRGMAVLEPGMICSNEPGYYKPGAYGIRIENLCVVTPPQQIANGERPMLGFETLTLAPIDRRLIVPSLLAPDELDWINDYHQRVDRVIGPTLGAQDRVWLRLTTEPLA